jgi:hypothetical protein
MRFAADYSETLEVFLLTSVDLDVGSLGSTENVQTIFELLPCSVEHVRWNSRDRIPDTGLAAKKNFQSFTVICRKSHVASSICLRATIFQNPEGTLWTHCILVPNCVAQRGPTSWVTWVQHRGLLGPNI